MDPNNIPVNKWCVVVFVSPDEQQKTYYKEQYEAMCGFDLACEQWEVSSRYPIPSPIPVVLLYAWDKGSWWRADIDSFQEMP